MATNFLNQNFDDEEDEDDDFNPAPVAGSDDDDDDKSEADKKPRISRQPSERPKQPTEDDEDEERANGGSSPPGDEGGLGDDADVGEDDEGEGEDLRDDEDEDEDEDDEEAISGRPRKRRKRAGLNQFFEEEAEVDEEDDAEEDEDDLPDGFVADTHPDDDADLDGADRDDRRHRELDQRREMDAAMDAEQKAEELRQRYGRNRTAAQPSGAFIPQNLLMPSVEDPSIWTISCKPGKEREIIMKISQKFVQQYKTKSPLKILSVFERGGPQSTMAGRIFVEARRKADVIEALSGVADVYPHSQNGTTLAPVKEMPDLLRVKKSDELPIGGYVRIKRGMYSGDLAMIQEVESNGLEVTVRLVPRLDYGMNEDDKAMPMVTNNLGGDAKRKRANASGLNAIASRPPQRLFSEQEARKKHNKLLSRVGGGLTGRSWNYKGENYEDGFLIKDYKIQHLTTQNVNPKLDEITKLTRIAADGTETLDLESLAHSLRNNTAENSYMPGDEVEVYDGEQRGLRGRTEGVNNNIVSIKVTHGDLTGQIVDVPMRGLRKCFEEGAHVKVIGGSRYKDETGTVIQVIDDKVLISSDANQTEITVFSKDLREATDSGGDAGLNKYDVHELVQLDPATVACVVRVDRETMRVLDQNGLVRTLMPSQITNKIEVRKNAVATDRNGSEIKVGDTVREVSGENKSGAILHIHRSFLFVHDRTQMENSGLFTTRCVNVTTLAAKGARVNSGPDLTKMNPALQMRNGANGGPSMTPPKTFGRDRTIGKTVTIRKGPYKGMLGIVKDSTDSTARVELHSKSKVVNIDKESLSIKDPITGQPMDLRSFGRGATGPNRGPIGNATPSRLPVDWSGGRTPMAAVDGGRTPAWGGGGGRTPAWSGAGADSGRTPAWKPAAGSQTSYGGAGNMTSYGGPAYGASGGGRTPAWSSSARTPYGGDHGSGGFSSGGGSSGFDAFAAGSRTPAYGSAPATGSRTPAWGGGAPSYDAPTPGRHDDFPTPYGGAPTPAASAPTPRFNEEPPRAAHGANTVPLKNSRFDAPTPRYDAPTPAASAPTPAAYGGGYGVDAPTPAAGAGDGPRYIDSDEE